MSWIGSDGAAEEFRPDAEGELHGLVEQPSELAGPYRQALQRFRHNRVAMTAFGFVVVVVAVAILAPLVAPQNPNTLTTSINAGPSTAHWLGTDDVGRDILSRLIYGARISMQVSFQVVLFALLAAVPLALLAGYRGRWAGSLIMRMMDALFCFPPLTLALAVSALLGAGVFTISIAIAIVFVPGFVRIIRAQVLAVREETYVEAARSIGSGTGRILRRHVLLNVMSPLTVQVAISFGYALLAEAGLSFLGFGVQSPQASWGTMLQSAYQFVLAKPWPMIPPGLAIVFTVLAFNLVGDGLRDALGRDAVIAAQSR